MIGEGDAARASPGAAAVPPTRDRPVPPAGPASRRSKSRARAATASRSGGRRSRSAPGEIVGIAAVEGNGQRELLRAVAGRLHPLRGRLEVARPVGVHPRGPDHRGTDPRADASPRTWCSGSGPTIRGSGGGRVDWRVARAAHGGAARGSTTSWRPAPTRRPRRSAAAISRRWSWRGSWRGSRGWSWRRTRPAGSTSGPPRRCTTGCAPRRRRGGRARLLERSRRGARAGRPGRWS